MNSTDKLFYFFGLLIFAGLICVAFLTRSGILVLSHMGFRCDFHSMTGLYCPGCGGTRAVIALVTGHPVQSFFLHPFVPCTAGFFGLYILWNSLASLLSHIKKETKIPFWHFRSLYVFLGLAILFLQWLAKNILLIVGGYVYI
ncbi:MAG: DUF2752 domain-containing protein [Eubacterium sp.]|nr:DUF2752 domain-containing protein [Eubacterium sp.]